MLNDLASLDSRVRPASIRIDRTSGVAGLQAGAELAQGEVLLFVDDDVVPEPGLVAGHAAWHERGSRRVVLGYMPVQRGPLRRPPDLLPALYDEAYEQACELFDQDRDAVLLGFWGGNFSMTRTEALRVGLFDPTFDVGYHWDWDFGLRCRAAGLEAIFDRSLLAQHHHQRGWTQIRAHGREQGASRLLVQARHQALIGMMVLDDILPGGPRVRRLIRRLSRPRLRPIAYAALQAAAELACAAGRPDLAVEAARLTMAVAFREGVISKSRTLGTSADRTAPRVQLTRPTD